MNAVQQCDNCGRVAAVERFPNDSCLCWDCGAAYVRSLLERDEE